MTSTVRRRVLRALSLCCILLVGVPAAGHGLEVARAAAPAPSITLSTNAVGNTFAPGQPVVVSLALTIPSGVPRTFTLGETELTFAGVGTALLTTTVTLVAGQPFRTVVPLRIAGRGYYELDVSLTDQSSGQQTLKALSVAVLDAQPAVADPTSAFGVAGSLTQAYGGNPQTLATAAAAMAAAGVRFDREEFNWQTIERAPGSGQFDFSRTDAAVLAAHAAGIQILGLLAYWGSLPQPDTTQVVSGTDTLNQVSGCTRGPVCAYTAQGNALYAQFAAAVVSRYRPGGALAQQQGWTDRYGISNWEVWNEPSTISFWRHDLAHFQDLYAALYRTAAAAIKGTDPAAAVMYDESGFAFDAALAANSSTSDILAIHSYSGGLDPDAALSSPTVPRGGQGTAPAAIGQYVASGKPVWITETGYTTNGSVTPRQQAQFLVRSFVNFLSAGVKKEFWFKFHEDSPGGDNLYSLVNQDFSPKPAYLAYATLTHHLSGTTFVQSVQLGTAVKGVLFGGNGGTEAVLWSTGETGTMVLPIPSGQAVDLMDNPTGVHDAASLTVPLSGDAVFVQIPGLAPAQVAPLLQAARLSGINPAGVDVRLAPGLSNGLPDIKTIVSARTNVPISGTVALQLPAGWTATPARVRFSTLAPGQSTSLVFHLNSVVDHRGDAVAATVATLAGAVATSSTTVTPYALTYGHPAIDGTLATWATASEADLIDLHPDQVVGIPGWTPQNLSARVFTMWDEQYFYLAAQVHDQTFDYAPIGYNMYQGDAIQYGWGMDPEAWNTDHGPNQFNVTAGLTHQGAANFQYHILGPWTDMRQAIAPDAVTGDLIYTTAIPWSRLGNYVPKAGGRFAFNLIINQNENHSRLGWIQFTPGMGIGFYPSEFPLWTIEQSNPAAGLRLGGMRAPMQGSISFALPAAQGHLEIHDGGMRALQLTINGTPLNLVSAHPGQGFSPFTATTIDLSRYLRAGNNVVQAVGLPSTRASAAVLSFFQ